MDSLDSFRCDRCERLADLIPIAPDLYLCDYCAGLPLFVQLSFESQGSCDLVTEELPPEIVWISAEVSQANVHQYVIDTLSSTHYHGEETIVARLASFIVHDKRGPIDGVLYDTGNLPAGEIPLHLDLVFDSSLNLCACAGGVMSLREYLQQMLTEQEAEAALHRRGGGGSSD